MAQLSTKFDDLRELIAQADENEATILLYKILQDVYKNSKGLNDAEKYAEAINRIRRYKNLMDYISNPEENFEASLIKDLQGGLNQNIVTDADIAKALGIEEKDLYSSEGGYQSIDGPTMRKLLQDAGLDFPNVLNYLTENKIRGDKTNILEGYNPDGSIDLSGWLYSALWGLLSPRTKEAILADRDISWKDAVGDLAELALSAAPVGGGTTALAKIFGKAGSKKLGGNVAGRVAKAGLDNMLVPLATEAIDAALYDAEDNTERSDFNLWDVALGTSINAAAPYLMKSGLGVFARPTGSRGNLAKVVENIAEDPFTNKFNTLAIAEKELGKDRTRLTKEQLDNLRDILLSEELIKDNPNLSRLAKYINNDYLFNPIKKDQAKMAKEYAEKLAKDPKALSNMKEQRALLEGGELARFNSNQGSVFPSDLMDESNLAKYGLTDQGKLGKVNDEKASKLSIDPESKIDPRITKSEKSAANLKEDTKYKEITNYEEVDGKKVPKTEKVLKTDPYYNRESEFDKEVMRLIEKNPVLFNVPKIGASGLRSFTTNKLAPEMRGVEQEPIGIINKNAKEQRAEKQAETEAEREYQAELDFIIDATSDKWEAGFKPNPIDGDIYYEAWKKWKSK